MEVPPNDPYLDFLTLGEVFDARYRLRHECPKCRTWAYADLRAMIARHGRETHWRALGSRCNFCGSMEEPLIIEPAGNRPPRPPAHLLGFCADRNIPLGAFCSRCKEHDGRPRQAYFSAPRLVARFGRSKRLDEVRPRCRSCGRRCFLLPLRQPEGIQSSS